MQDKLYKKYWGIDDLSQTCCPVSMLRQRSK